MNRYYANDLIEYLEKVKTIEKIFGTYKWHKLEHVWFRGLSNINYKLLPTLYRDASLATKEREINRDFKLKSVPFLKSRDLNKFELLFVGRHHGLPTRLLDWSEGSLISLFFAVSDYKNKQDGIVWLLRPRLLNRIHFGNTIPESDNTKLKEYLSIPLKGKYPVAIRSSYISDRIIAQRGYFTIHGSEIDALEEVQNRFTTKQFLECIRIPFDAKLNILRQLAKVGITYGSLFPDLGGLSQEIEFVYS